ncbi:uncharacterized protein LOC126879825 [Diabrotica virgifera virgifera]|uniref:Uncharacterized protein n=1 Tax=Diabrotica virgifera virgifera TaxID=50390 RepID=A0ABM5JMB0_DIAVI|nr:uncharacterized protein LOC126879825 [Diabrotica virgifera virgifera]
MKSMFVVLLSLICLALLVAGDDPEPASTSTETPVISTTEVPAPISTSIGEDKIYVEESNVTDPTYEIDAVEALKEAMALFPVDSKQLLETFSKLFNVKHQIDGGWKVAEKCSYVYIPNADSLYIELRVINSDGERLILIFS